MSKTVEAVIIATDVKGRNKARFCESFKRRYYLLTKQNFTIHDAILLPEKMTKQESLEYIIQHKEELRDSNSLSVVEKTLERFKPKFSLKTILLRKRKQLTTDEVMTVVESVLNA